MICSYIGCNKKSRSPGSKYCEAHYYRIRRKGSPGTTLIKKIEMHGKHDLIEHRIWVAMRGRCSNPKNRRFKYYGGRGIKVCKRWNKFSLFFKDMGKRPGKGFSIERINNDGNYSPGNCKWGSAKEQSRNRRTVKMSLEKSVRLIELKKSGIKTSKIKEIFGISQTTVDKIFRGDSWKS